MICLKKKLTVLGNDEHPSSSLSLNRSIHSNTGLRGPSCIKKRKRKKNINTISGLENTSKVQIIRTWTVWDSELREKIAVCLLGFIDVTVNNATSLKTKMLSFSTNIYLIEPECIWLTDTNSTSFSTSSSSASTVEDMFLKVTGR